MNLTSDFNPPNNPGLPLNGALTGETPNGKKAHQTIGGLFANFLKNFSVVYLHYYLAI